MKCVGLARVFKRSWVDMAGALFRVRREGLYRKWGYETIHAYALDELRIRKATVDKLTGSYGAIETHVPHVLDWDGVGREIPSIDAVDYFARALGPPEDGEAPPAEVVEELTRAVFEDGASAHALRRRFNPVLNPLDEAAERQRAAERLRSSARRVESLITTVEGLSEERVASVSAALEGLRDDLDALLG